MDCDGFCFFALVKHVFWIHRSTSLNTALRIHIVLKLPFFLLDSTFPNLFSTKTCKKKPQEGLALPKLGVVVVVVDGSFPPRQFRIHQV
jgi:hypothetical protein